MGTILSIFRYREFVYEIARHELRVRNKGAALGHLWLALRPLIETATYLLVVAVFLSKSTSEAGGALGYAVYLLSGMLPWQILTRTLGEAPSLIRDRIELVKQVVYPIETLPVTSFAVSLIGASITFVIYVVLAAITGSLSWTVVLLPVPLILLVAFVTGTAWVFMVVGVVLKDLREVVTICLGLLTYLSPVIASPAMVGEAAWRIILWNPLSHVVICFRDVFQGQLHAASWFVFAAMAGMALSLGSYTVTRARIHINQYI